MTTTTDGIGLGRGQGASSAALIGFREALHGCLDGWGDALFELADAALDGPTLRWPGW